MENTNDPGIRLPELVRHIDRLLKSKEKRGLLDIIETLEKEYDCEKQAENQPDVDNKDLSEKLGEKSLSPDRLQTILNTCDDKKESCVKDKDTKPGDAERVVPFLPDIQTSSPLRPTELLCRILGRTKKMKPEIFIPSMTLTRDSDSSQCSVGDSRTASPRKHVSNRRNKQETKKIPHFNYEHGDGQRRNLPGQPELIRLLTEPEMHLGGRNVSNPADGEHNAQNTWMSLYGGTVSPPLIDKNQQKRNKRRKILCKYCKRSPGDHQKWCVYYTDIRDFNEPTVTLVGSFTDDDLDLQPNVDKETDKVGIQRSKTTLNETAIKQDLPDYSSLHRDVYIRALADSQARSVMRNAHDFVGQTTKPFVFSYFQKGVGFKRHRINDEMKHIFGKNHTDFTEYYKLLSNSD